MIERYHESSLTRWLEGTFGEWTGIVIMGGGAIFFLAV